MNDVAIGEDLGHYRILGHLGSGGMGEVYLAEDTNLDRRVALKILPRDLADDPERLARFRREAKAVAALNHPNIVTIHAVEEVEGLHFLAMELVEGEGLGGQIPEDGLALDRFFTLAIPLADGVATAHEQRILHRDLKPANVMVTPEDRVKILDFGLARLRPRSETGSGGAETTAPLTETGRVMGTVPYMAPEQLQGESADHRSDIFSLGVILYEMTTGRRPFRADTSVGLISSILRDRPESVTEIRSDLPRHLGRIIRRCLEKDPRRRYQSVLDVRNALEDLQAELESEEASSPDSPTAASSVPDRSRVLPVALVASLVLVVAAVAFWIWRADGAAEIDPTSSSASFTQLTQQVGRELQPTLSPDGRFVSYASDTGESWDIHLLRIGGRNPINLTAGSSTDNRQPAFSPGGSEIVFRSERNEGGIFLMGATGEAVRRLADFGYNPAWSPDGRRVVVGTESIDGYPYSRFQMSELWVVDVESGEKEKIFDGDAVQPTWSPHGHRIAFWGIHRGTHTGQRDVLTIGVDGSDPVAVTEDPALDWSPVWSPDGRYLYFASDRSGTLNLWRARIDEKSGEVQGPLEPVATPSQWAGELSFSGDGSRMTFSSQDRRANIARVDFDPATGRVSGEPQMVTELSLPLVDPALSADGKRLVFRTVLPQEDLFSIRTDGTELRQVTEDPHRDRGPSWGSEGEQIYFYSNRSGSYEIWRVRPDGSELEQITRTEGRSFWFPIVSPKGDLLATFNRDGTFLLDLTKPLPVTELQSLPNPSPSTVFQSNSWSPDGNLLAGIGWVGSWEREMDILALDLRSREYRRLGAIRRDPRLEWEGPLAWLPGGRALLTSAAGTLKLVELETGEVREVLEPARGSQLGSPMLSGDAGTLYYMDRADEANVWLMTLETRGGGS